MANAAAAPEDSALLPGANVAAVAAGGADEGQTGDTGRARAPRAVRPTPGAKVTLRSHAATEYTPAAAAAATTGSAAATQTYDVRDTLEFAARRGGGDAALPTAAQAALAHAGGAIGSSPLHTPVAAAPAQLAVAAPLQSAQFAPAFSAQVASIAAQGIGSAEITLNPKELGPVKVSLTLSGETMEIAFAAAQPETRQAIEQSLPLLRTMLSEQGLNLSQASVGQGAFGQPQGRRDAHDPGATRADTQGGTLADSRRKGDADSPGPGSSRSGSGLVDLFA